MNKSYSCDSGRFSSYLAKAFSRFVEYKINVCGYIPDSYIQPLKLFDAYCCDYPQNRISMKLEVVVLATISWLVYFTILLRIWMRQ